MFVFDVFVINLFLLQYLDELFFCFKCAGGLPNNNVLLLLPDNSEPESTWSVVVESTTSYRPMTSSSGYCSCFHLLEYLQKFWFQWYRKSVDWVLPMGWHGTKSIGEWRRKSCWRPRS